MKYFALLVISILTISSYSFGAAFIAKSSGLKDYYFRDNIILIASMGRSGSTLLTDAVEAYASNSIVLKAHLLPPDKRYFGKVIFIFSNPDKAAESALHCSCVDKKFLAVHFSHVATADQIWLKVVRGKQNLKQNLLSYDALGYSKHLDQWLSLEPSDAENSQVLAIKYENLWDADTLQALKDFLNLDDFSLPEKVQRGAGLDDLFPKETYFRAIYNLGTPEDPRYSAYDEARDIWENAPAFSFYKLSPNNRK